MKVVCLGDSITGGCDRTRYVKWTEILQLMLRAGTNGAATRVVNYGTPGDTSDGLLRRLLTGDLCAGADIAVVLIGGNDGAGKGAGGRETTRANLRRILTTCSGSSRHTLALLYHRLWEVTSSPAAWMHLADSNPAMEEEAAALGIPTLDMHAPMAMEASRVPVDELVDPSDLVHLRPGGEMIYATTVFNKLDQLGWLGSAGSGRGRTAERPSAKTTS